MCACYLHLYFKKLFYLFPRVGASQAREFQIATTTTPVSAFFSQIPCFLKCACMLLQCFPSKHGNLHICRHKTVPKHNFFTMFPIPLSPQTLENTAIYTVFFSFSMFQCRWPTQTYIQKNPSQTLFFFTVFLQFFPSKP